MRARLAARTDGSPAPKAFGAAQAVAPCLDQSALPKVAEVVAGGAFH